MTERTGAALVTGASAGIGVAFARQLAAAGYDLILVARREPRLKELAAELEVDHGVRCEVHAADLADPDAPGAIVEGAWERGQAVDVLINNAGFSGRDAFADTSWEVLAAQLQIMVTAPTHLARLLAPGMVSRGRGRIVNLASVSALLPPPASLLYSPIKRYVLDLSRALHAELSPQGVHVTALCPGLTRTEFHDVMGVRAEADRFPSLGWSTPEEVVRAGWAAVEAGHPICVPGVANKVLVAAFRPLPLVAQDWVVNRVNPF